MDTTISDIRNAFITSDDASTCEELCYECDLFTQSLEDDYPHRQSPELNFVPDLNFYHWKGLRLKREQLTLNVKPSYQMCVSGDASGFPKFIDTSPMPPRAPFDPSKKSALTLALEGAQSYGQLVNKFNNYAVFDGRSVDSRNVCLSKSSASSRLRPFEILFWEVPGIQAKTFISVQPTASCTVRDLIGLSLWQYFNEKPSVIAAFNSEPCHIGKDALSIIKQIEVYIHDEKDDFGELPPLQSVDSIYKYDFEAFCLVESVATAPSVNQIASEPQIYVTVHLAGGVSRIRLPASASLERVMQEAINRRKLRQHEGYAYYLEEWREPPTANTTFAASTAQSQQQPASLTVIAPESGGSGGCGDAKTMEGRGGRRKSLDLSMTLAEYTKNNNSMLVQFVLIREHSRYDPVMWDTEQDAQSCFTGGWGGAVDSIPITPSAPSMVAPLKDSSASARSLQSRKYRAALLRGPSSREVTISVSRDRLEVQASKLQKIFRGTSKFLSIPMSHVLDCNCLSNYSAPCPGGAPLSKVKFAISYLPTQQANLTCSSGQQQDDEKATDSIDFGLEDVQRQVFETQWSSARAVSQQVNGIFACCPSRLRDTYLCLRLNTVPPAAPTSTSTAN